jgi:hypothetical protein
VVVVVLTVVVDDFAAVVVVVDDGVVVVVVVDDGGAVVVVVVDEGVDVELVVEDVEVVAPEGLGGSVVVVVDTASADAIVLTAIPARNTTDAIVLSAGDGWNGPPRRFRCRPRRRRLIAGSPPVGFSPWVLSPLRLRANVGSRHINRQ